MRQIRRAPLPLAALAVLLGGAAPGRAQDAQYWDIQYGPVAQLLGGAVVGSTRDPSATFYNPGGLALEKDRSFLLSVQAFNRRTMNFEPLEGGEVLDTSQTDWGTFPGFIAGSFPEGWLGERTHLAFSLLTRQEFDIRIDQRLAGVTSGNADYGVETLFDQQMQETWGGLTVSREIGKRWGVGATLFGVYRGQRARTEQSLQLVNPDGTGVTALGVNDFDYSNWRLLGKLGVAYDGDSIRLGAAFTTPSADLFGSGNIGVTRSASGLDVDADGRPDNVLANGIEEDLASSYKSPWSFAGGASWRRGSLQLHGTVEYFGAVDPFTVLGGQTLTPAGQPVALTQSFASVFNVGIAGEYWLGGLNTDDGVRARGIVLYGAFATDHTSSPEVDDNEAATSNQDHYHVTGGCGFSLGRNRFNLGVTYAFGSKERVFGFTNLPPSIPIFGNGVPVRSSFSRFVFLLGYLFGTKS